MNVTVTDGIQVVHNDAHHFGGETLDVPERLANLWIRYGWAAEVAGDMDNRRARVAQLRDAGRSIREIADELGVTRSAVERDIKALN